MIQPEIDTLNYLKLQKGIAKFTIPNQFAVVKFHCYQLTVKVTIQRTEKLVTNGSKSDITPKLHNVN